MSAYVYIRGPIFFSWFLLHRGWPDCCNDWQTQQQWALQLAEGNRLLQQYLLVAGGSSSSSRSWRGPIWPQSLSLCLAAALTFWVSSASSSRLTFVQQTESLFSQISQWARQSRRLKAAACTNCKAIPKNFHLLLLGYRLLQLPCRLRPDVEPCQHLSTPTPSLFVWIWVSQPSHYWATYILTMAGKGVLYAVGCRVMPLTFILWMTGVPVFQVVTIRKCLAWPVCPRWEHGLEWSGNKTFCSDKKDPGTGRLQVASDYKLSLPKVRVTTVRISGWRFRPALKPNTHVSSFPFSRLKSPTFHDDCLSRGGEWKRRKEKKVKKKKEKGTVSKLHSLTVRPTNRIMYRFLNLDIGFHLLLKCICVF